MPEKIYILTGPIQSGKTTKLMQWAANKKNVFGILTPVVDNKRVFLDLTTKEQFRMEAKPNEENVFTIGRFVFSKQSFEKAINILTKALKENDGWLVVDEIGPLELRGEGFHDAIMEILKTEINLKILFVIRNTILEKALMFYRFNIEEITIIDKDNNIFEK